MLRRPGSSNSLVLIQWRKFRLWNYTKAGVAFSSVRYWVGGNGQWLPLGLLICKLGPASQVCCENQASSNLCSAPRTPPGTQ